MKRLLAGALALLIPIAAFATTLNPIQLLNPTGSTSGQAILSTGASTAPAWGNVAATALAAQAANTVVANVTASSASPTAFAMPSCSTSASALNWTTSTGFTCNTAVNASTLGGATFASPGAIGSTTPGTGKFTTLQATSSITPSSTAGIVGTTTNDNAQAGSVGEYISSNVAPGSAVAYTSNTPMNVTSISLTAGDWDVWGTVAPIPGTQITAVQGWISTTSATSPTNPNNGAEVYLPVSLTAGQGAILPVGTIRLSLSGTTTVYLSANIVSTASGTIYGFIAARRRR
jgi:hypothetical protein